MANDKYADELLSDEELDKVAGGYVSETYNDFFNLVDCGLLNHDDVYKNGAIGAALNKLGYTGYTPNQNKANIYTDKNGNQISHKQFWENFVKENENVFDRAVLEKIRQRERRMIIY